MDTSAVAASLVGFGFTRYFSPSLAFWYANHFKERTLIRENTVFCSIILPGTLRPVACTAVTYLSDKDKEKLGINYWLS